MGFVFDYAVRYSHIQCVHTVTRSIISSSSQQDKAVLYQWRKNGVALLIPPSFQGFESAKEEGRLLDARVGT